MTAASLAGTPVHFDASNDPAPLITRRSMLASRRPPATEALLWVLIVMGFATAGVLAMSWPRGPIHLCMCSPRAERSNLPRCALAGVRPGAAMLVERLYSSA